MFILQTILEFGVAFFIIWGLFNEQKLVDFEDRIIARIKAKIKQKKANANVYNHPADSSRRCA